MLPVEMALHLELNVRSASLSVNGLVAALERSAPGLESGVFGAVLDQAQGAYLQAVRSGAQPPLVCPRCGGSEWVQRGSRPRVLKTSRGRLAFRLRQVSCRSCACTWSPFVERLGLQPWQRLSEELLERLVGLATEMSYAKASAWGGEMLAASLAPMTIWRAVQQRAPGLRFTAGRRPVRTLELDGTRVPAGDKPRGEEVNLALQIGARRRVRRRWQRAKRLVGFALGAESWPRALPPKLRPQLVVSDGAPGIAPAVSAAYPATRQQRCEWHLVYSLGHSLWLDAAGTTKARRDRLRAELHALLFAPYRGFWRRAAVWRWNGWRLRTYPQSQALVAEALPQVCYPRPSAVRTTSHAEREMRELNRRTNVGVRWSVAGIGNLLRLRLARRLNRDDYTRLWPHRVQSQVVEVQVSAVPMSTV